MTFQLQQPSASQVFVALWCICFCVCFISFLQGFLPILFEFSMIMWINSKWNWPDIKKGWWITSKKKKKDFTNPLCLSYYTSTAPLYNSLVLITYRFSAQLWPCNGKCMSMQQETGLHFSGFLIGCCDHSIQKMYWVMKLRFCLTKASIAPLCNSLVLVTKLILSLA